MAKYKDFELNQGEYGKASEYYDNNALVLSIRNILLSRPGNFPFNPSIGLDIEQYEFDLLDDQTIADIKTALNRQVVEYNPDIQNIQISIKKIPADNGQCYLGISVRSTMSGEITDANFLILKDHETVHIFNEIY